MSNQEDVVSSSQEDLPSPIMSQETFQHIEGVVNIQYQDIIEENSQYQEYSTPQYTLLANKGKTYHQLESASSTSLINQATSRLTYLRNSSQECSFAIDKNLSDFNGIESLSTSLVTRKVGKFTEECLPALQGRTFEDSAVQKPQYSFDVRYVENNQPSKSTPWTYSKKLHKLFVSFNLPCPVQFHIHPEPPEGCYIRATPYYKDPVHANGIPRRCPTHQAENEPSNIGFDEVNHVIRCNSTDVIYHKDTVTGRLSVLVPYQKPDPLIAFATYNYLFTCYSSCMGGMNRRAIDVTFTLEYAEAILGKRSVEVRVCACPGRDRMKCEQKMSRRMRPDDDLQVSSSTIDPIPSNQASNQRIEHSRQPLSNEPEPKRPRLTNVAANTNELNTVSVSFQVRGREAARAIQMTLDSIKVFALKIQEISTIQTEIPEILLSDEEIKKESQQRQSDK